MEENTTTGTTSSGSTGIGTAPGNGGFGVESPSSLAQTAGAYAGKVSDAAVQAKEYVTDKVTAVGEKIKDLDFNEVAENAKDYARKNPAQAILISAGIGLLLGILVRGRR
jgi:ElaB/YqjD/DUF883 family membrane-anchored ribosome-binding protein